MRDLIIIGGGAGGLSAAIYACNACLDFCVIEKFPMHGGQILNSSEINNYPGVGCTGGFELGKAFYEHAEKSGTEFINDEVYSVVKTDRCFEIKGRRNSYASKAVIVACGAERRKLGVKGEEELAGRGVSYCATCDGSFFRNKAVAVVGGGDVACEDALYLSNLCERVYLIHRRDTLRGEKYLQNKIFERNKIQVLFSTRVTEISGGSSVEGLKLDNGEFLPVQGVFIAVGIAARTDFLEDIKTDSGGFIIAGEDCKASAEGLFAVGDIRSKPLRQIVTAAADGANAVKGVEEYLLNKT